MPPLGKCCLSVFLLLLPMVAGVALDCGPRGEVKENIDHTLTCSGLQPGQFVTWVKRDPLSGDFSVASCHGTGFCEVTVSFPYAVSRTDCITSLTIHDVRRDDRFVSGEWSCVMGESRASCNVRVVFLPIVKECEVGFDEENHRVVGTCEISKVFPEPTCIWFEQFKGKERQISTDHTSVDKTDYLTENKLYHQATCHLDSPLPTKEGHYQYKLLIIPGHTEPHLTYTSPTYVVLPIVKECEVGFDEENHRVVGTCEISKVFPEPTCIWFEQFEGKERQISTEHTSVDKTEYLAENKLYHQATCHLHSPLPTKEGHYQYKLLIIPGHTEPHLTYTSPTYVADQNKGDSLDTSIVVGNNVGVNMLIVAVVTLAMWWIRKHKPDTQAILENAVPLLPKQQKQMAQRGNSGQAGQNTAMEDWRQAIENNYPEWETRTYCVPPVHFNRPNYTTGLVAGLKVLVLQLFRGLWPASTSQTSSASQPAISQSTSASPAVSTQPSPPDLRPFPGEPVQVQESDSRDDFNQQHVLFNLQALGQKQNEPMFIVTQLNYRDYLNKRAYSQAAACLPRPVDLPRPDCDGDFDFLLPHLRFGIAVLELKSVGLHKPHKPQPDAVVAKKVGQAARQLDKSGQVIRYILQDIAPGVRIVKAIVLPYVTSRQLKKVLKADSNLRQLVCTTLDMNPPDVSAAVHLCLCKDQLSHRTTPYKVTDHTLTKLSGWFRRRVSAAVDPAMNRDVYLDILARLVGPASTVAVHCITPPRLEVRTLGEAVSELGERLARVVLTPAQLSLLNRVDSLPRVCLVGPPGTGKTLVLVLVGLHWLSKGHDVLVLSTWDGSLAVSRVIVRQLEQREVPTPSAGTVRFRHFDQDSRQTDVEAEIQSLAATATGHTLHILMDEAWFVHRVVGPSQCRLVAKLSARVPGLHLWAACLSHVDIPQGLQVERLTVPLRSAPAIVREIRPAVDTLSSIIPIYTDSGVASPSDGPTVIRLCHEGGQHDGRYPVHCKQCGLDVGEVLKHQLHVGVTGHSSQSPTGRSTTTSPPPLQYRDVLVLTRSEDFTDEKREDRGDVVTLASGFVTGLRLADIPVAVVSRHDVAAERDRALTDLATAQTDQVTLTRWGYTNGLERKVVVFLPGRWQGMDDDYSDKQLEDYDRLAAVSRCSSQLVWVHVPSH